MKDQQSEEKETHAETTQRQLALRVLSKVFLVFFCGVVFFYSLGY